MNQGFQNTESRSPSEAGLSALRETRRLVHLSLRVSDIPKTPKGNGGRKREKVLSKHTVKGCHRFVLINRID